MGAGAGTVPALHEGLSCHARIATGDSVADLLAEVALLRPAVVVKTRISRGNQRSQQEDGDQPTPRRYAPSFRDAFW